MRIARSPLVAGLSALARRRSVLMAYHGVAPRMPDLDPHNLSVTPAAFRTQVDLLIDARANFDAWLAAIRDPRSAIRDPRGA